MTREEQNLQSVEAIITAAAAEFGRHGYEGASLNTALAEAGISKGKIYHYFESKEQVYLACVGACFDRLMEKLQEGMKGHKPTLQKYFMLRWEFFEDYPSLGQLFMEATERPPRHLQAEIQMRKNAFDAFNLSIFQFQLAALKLRKGISEEDAIEYFMIFQAIFHQTLTRELPNVSEQNALLHHEQRLKKTLDILLYGLAEEEIP